MLVSSIFLTNWLYSFFSIHLHAYIVQLLNSLLGFFLFGCGMFLVTHLFPRQRKKQAEFYQSINHVIKQIAQVNFNVSLPNISGNCHPGNPFAEIVDNIHYTSKELRKWKKCTKNLSQMYPMKFNRPLPPLVDLLGH